MRIIGITDIHGDTRHAGRLAQLEPPADVLLVAGDVTHFDREDAIAGVISSLRPLARQQLAVLGNCDYPGSGTYLSDADVNLDRRNTQWEAVCFVGIGGSLPCPGKTPNEFTEAELRSQLGEAVAGCDAGNSIVLVSHQPPHGTSADLISNGNHVGSHSVRSFIEKHQPLVCLCGHIHEGRGLDSIGDTRVINPGPFKDGRYAVIDIAGGEVRADLRSTITGAD